MQQNTEPNPYSTTDKLRSSLQKTRNFLASLCYGIFRSADKEDYEDKDEDKLLVHLSLSYSGYYAEFTKVRKKKSESSRNKICGQEMLMFSGAFYYFEHFSFNKFR